MILEKIMRMAVRVSPNNVHSDHLTWLSGGFSLNRYYQREKVMNLISRVEPAIDLD
jgi:hypothetical protein